MSILKLLSFHRSRTIDFKNFKKFVEDLAHTKNIEPEELFLKLRTCGLPETKVNQYSGTPY